MKSLSQIALVTVTWMNPEEWHTANAILDAVTMCAAVTSIAVSAVVVATTN
jgi:hypothetical protein